MSESSTVDVPFTIYTQMQKKRMIAEICMFWLPPSSHVLTFHICCFPHYRRNSKLMEVAVECGVHLMRDIVSGGQDEYVAWHGIREMSGASLASG